MESSRLMLIIQNQYFVMEKYEKRPKLLFISHGRDLEKILRYLIYTEKVTFCVIKEIAAIDLRVKEGGTKNKFYFCLKNLSTSAIHGFMSTHKSNRICRTLD